MIFLPGWLVPCNLRPSKMMPVPYHGCTCHLRYAAAKEHAAVVASNRKQVNYKSCFKKASSNFMFLPIFDKLLYQKTCFYQSSGVLDKHFCANKHLRISILKFLLCSWLRPRVICRTAEIKT